MQTSITIELSLTNQIYTRFVYHYLDLASDIGGLFGALRPLGLVLVIAFQFFGAHNFLMAQMYRFSNSDSAKQGLSNIQWNCCLVSKLNLQRMGASKMCFRESKRDKLINMRFRQFQKELHLTYVLKHIRVFKALFKERMTKEKWKQSYD